MIRSRSLLLGIALYLPAAAAGSCTTFPNTDLRGHDLHATKLGSPSACCSSCVTTTGCSFWTFMPPSTCYLKCVAQH